MKRIIFLMAAALSLVACNQNTPDDTKKGGDTPTSQHQPSDPATWSPVGHVYVYETTWENSPASDHYWVWVLDFISKDSVMVYQTPNRDLSYHSDFMHLVEPNSYIIEYPKLTRYYLTTEARYLEFNDTTTIVSTGLNQTYTILMK